MENEAVASAIANDVAAAGDAVAEDVDVGDVDAITMDPTDLILGWSADEGEGASSFDECLRALLGLYRQRCEDFRYRS